MVVVQWICCIPHWVPNRMVLFHTVPYYCIAWNHTTWVDRSRLQSASDRQHVNITMCPRSSFSRFYQVPCATRTFFQLFVFFKYSDYIFFTRIQILFFYYFFRCAERSSYSEFVVYRTGYRIVWYYFAQYHIIVLCGIILHVPISARRVILAMTSKLCHTHIRPPVDSQTSTNDEAVIKINQGANWYRSRTTNVNKRGCHQNCCFNLCTIHGGGAFSPFSPSFFSIF
jgi:hypothetical protein